MIDKAKLALVGAVAAVIFASSALAQTINGGDETGNASSYIVIDRLLRTLRFVTQALVPLVGMGSMHMRWSGAHTRIPLHVPACLSIQTVRRSLEAAALATTNCCSRKVTDHPCTKKVGRTGFAHFPVSFIDHEKIWKNFRSTENEPPANLEIKP